MLLQTYKVVEINNSMSLRAGHMVSQAKYKTSQPVENGVFFQFKKDTKDELVLAGNADGIGAVMLHYTTPLNTMQFAQGDKYFAVEPVNGAAYPNCLFIHENDTFTTDNFTGDASSNKYAVVDKATGKLKLVANEAGLTAANGVGPVFAIAKSTLADGTAAIECTAVKL